jgi:hypothetical protein
LVVALAIAPPLLCVVWYVLWRRNNPDEGRLVRRRRSQAAEQALKGLSNSDDVGAGRVAGVLAGYLRQRLDLAAAEPTPREASRHLHRLGVSPALIRQTGDLFRACDAARFSAMPAPGNRTLAGQAAQLILALEAEPCSSYAW